MSKVVSALILVAMFVASTSLEAQVLTPPINFDCNAMPGSDSTWNMGIESPDLQVQGTLEIIQMNIFARGSRVVVASVLLDSESKAQAGFQFYLERRTFMDRLQVGIVNPTDPTAETVILTHFWKGKPLKFTLTMSNPGDITMRLGDESTSLKVNGFEQYRLSLSCSAAHVTFSDIVIAPPSGGI